MDIISNIKQVEMGTSAQKDLGSTKKEFFIELGPSLPAFLHNETSLLKIFSHHTSGIKASPCDSR